MTRSILVPALSLAVFSVGSWWLWIRPVNEGELEGPARTVSWRTTRAFPMAWRYQAWVQENGDWVRVGDEFDREDNARGAALEKAGKLSGLITGLRATANTTFG